MVRKSKGALHALLSAVFSLTTVLEQTVLLFLAPTHAGLLHGSKHLSAFAVRLLLKTRHLAGGLASALKLIRESRRTAYFEFLAFKRNIQVRPHCIKRERKKEGISTICCHLLKQSNVALKTLVSI